MRQPHRILRSTSIAFAALLILAVGAANPREACAHGGNFNPPPPPPPPSETEPPRPPPPPPPPPDVTDPPPEDPPEDTPPETPDDAPEDPPVPEPPEEPEPPKTGVGEPPIDGPPETAPPPPSMPDQPKTVDAGSLPQPTSPGATGGAGNRPTGGRTARTDPDTLWSTWWALNRWQYLPSREDVVRRRRGAVTGRDAVDALLTAWEQRRALLARSVALPYLWSVLTPGSRAPEEIRAAALIALARVAERPEAVDLVLHYARHPRMSALVRESAAIALGHFRRSEPARRLEPAKLGLLRRQLLEIVDDGHTPVRARAFAALSLGMLADQPYATSLAKDGRMVTRALWERLGNRYVGNDIPVALFTALGMQPPAGVPEGVRDGLQAIALGKRLRGQGFSAIERSHALSARVRLGGRGWPAVLSRLLGARNVPAEVRRAGFIGLGARAASLSADDRVGAFDAWKAGMRRAKDPLTEGLGAIALGKLLAAELEATDDGPLLRTTDAADRLTRHAVSGNALARGFGAIALGLAARAASGDAEAERAFRADAVALVRTALASRKGDDRLAGAYAAALGLLEDEASVPALVAILRDRGRAPGLRGHAAVALAQIGDRSPAVLVSLQAALMDRRNTTLRKEAGLALSFLARGGESRLLLEDMKRSPTQRTLAQAALALGQIGQLDALKAMLAAARDEAQGDEPRALAVAAMGLILNPEDRPSLTRIRFDANYPARTSSLHEALDIL